MKNTSKNWIDDENKLFKELECDMDLIGATAIEDELQD